MSFHCSSEKQTPILLKPSKSLSLRYHVLQLGATPRWLKNTLSQHRSLFWGPDPNIQLPIWHLSYNDHKVPHLLFLLSPSTWIYTSDVLLAFHLHCLHSGPRHYNRNSCNTFLTGCHTFTPNPPNLWKKLIISAFS